MAARCGRAAPSRTGPQDGPAAALCKADLPRREGAAGTQGRGHGRHRSSVCAAGMGFTGLKASVPEFQQNENKGKIQIVGGNFCIQKKINNYTGFGGESF